MRDLEGATWSYALMKEGLLCYNTAKRLSFHSQVTEIFPPHATFCRERNFSGWLTVKLENRVEKALHLEEKVPSLFPLPTSETI